MRSSISSFALGLVLALSCAAPAAQASTLIFGTGLAASCSQSAVLGDSKELALEVCDKAIYTENLTPSDLAKTYVNRAVIRLRRADYKGAHKDMDKAQTLMPLLGEIYVNRGVVLFMEERYPDAITSFDKGISLGVDEMDKAFYDRGLTYEQMENYPAAYADFTKSTQINPDWDWPKRELTRYSVRPK